MAGSVAGTPKIGAEGLTEDADLRQMGAPLTAEAAEAAGSAVFELVLPDTATTAAEHLLTGRGLQALP